MKTKIIGIDPDIKKSGVAIYDAANNSLEWSCMNIIDLFSYLIACNEEIFLVVIERGEANKAFFASKYNAKNANAALKIAMNVGKNFAITDVLAFICKQYNINHEFYTPKTSKLSRELLGSILGEKITDINQEEIDAVRCILSRVVSASCCKM